MWERIVVATALVSQCAIVSPYCIFMHATRYVCSWIYTKRSS